MIGNVAKTENGVYKFFYTKPENCRVSEFEIENSVEEIETLHTSNEDYIKAVSSEEGKVKLTEKVTDYEYYAYYNIEYPYTRKKFYEYQKYSYESRKAIEKKYTKIIFCLVSALVTSLLIHLFS
jgi:hypothetical protein